MPVCRPAPTVEGTTFAPPREARLKARGELAPPASDILAAALDAATAGVTIVEAHTGATIYANTAARGHAAREAEARDAEPAPGIASPISRVAAGISVEGCDYDVVTSLDMTAEREREAELTRRAFFDELTGLPKTALIERTINNMVADGTAPFALAFIDVDNFKFINDYYGHAVGDRLLVRIAERIVEGSRSSDILARVGGDEFVLLTSPIESFADVGPQVNRLSARFKEPFFIDGFEIFSSASIGVSLYPAHGQSYEALRASADSAMYRVKEASKGGVKLFDESLSRAATARMEVEQRLRLAIRDKRFCCAFQPKVDFRSDTVVGMEVLLRWRDENGILRAPGEFIKLAIELGLMDDITMIVLAQVIEQMELIDDTFGPQASISLNVAAKQAGDFAFMNSLVAALVETGYPSRFVLELTEEAFIAAGPFQQHVLPLLRRHGIGISIDDFGVGYSSLSVLAEITADELKIDRSFVTDLHRKPRNQAIVKLIEMLATSLGMRVVVEGVETEEELAYILAETGISCGQGFFFAKPMFLLSPQAPKTPFGAGRERSREMAAPRSARQNRR